MFARLSALRYLCSSASPLTNQVFKSIRDPTIRQQINSNVSQNKQKLDALSNVLNSLSHLQIQYLVALQNQKALSDGNKISDNLVFSTGDQKQTVIQYLYQKRWIAEVWKDYHILTSLYSDENDKEGQTEAAEVVKQIYQFQLTSVDPAQKIKVIKVIRELLNLGLKQAKDIVDKAPTVMKKGKKEEGEKLKEDLAKNGCVVTLK